MSPIPAQKLSYFDMADEETVRCRKCRKVLITATECLINAHSQRHQRGKTDSTEEVDECEIDSEKSCLYIAEDSYPSFVLEAIDESSWTKGKLKCPGCQARLGSFNFISGSHCACNSHIVPQVHLLVSKVDVRRTKEALPQPVSYPDRPVSLSAMNIEALPLLISSGSSSESTSRTDFTPTPNLQPCNDGNSPDVDSLSNTSQVSIEKTEAMPSASSSSQSESPKRGNRLEMRQSRRQSWKHGDSEDSIETGVDECISQVNSTKTSNFHILPAEEIATDSSSEEDEIKIKPEDIPEHMTCSVCLDLLYSPLVTQPCGHVFCEPCLRRVAKRNPTDTNCPLCRQLIGQCMPSKELSFEIREKFPDLLRERQLFERKHNIQHLPLPWNRDFRLKQYVVNSSGGIVQMAGGWRPILLLLAGNALGLGSLAFLKWYLEAQKEEGAEDECDADLYQYLEQ